MEAKIIMLKGEKGDAGGSVWGNISGTLSSQADLNSALNSKAATSSLGDVAFSNNYNDLNNRPDLKTVATTGSYADLTNTPNLKTVATTGSYTDLINKPFIPTKTSDLTNDANFVTKSLLLDYVYPVGSYYWSSESTNPSGIFGGTWEQIKDKFILAAGDTYTAGNTGGEATHTLTVSEMPNHQHRCTELSGVAFCMGGDNGGPDGTSGYYKNTTEWNTGKTGGGGAHNNMPPYLVAYCFRRTA